MDTKEIVTTRRRFLQNTFMSFGVPGLLGANAIGRLMSPFYDSVGSDARETSGLLKSDQKTSKTYEKRLSFYNTHTGESMKNVVFWAGDYVSENVHLINKLFRDHRTGDMTAIDLKLLDLLHKLHQKLDVNAPFHLISGFRSSKTNAMLHENSSGVAKVSQHTFGRAADIALPKACALSNVYKAAKMLGLGGVGLYNEFVHVDVGRVRYW
jgi:uncharacterized protein YcbK (DUF882 family)